MYDFSRLLLSEHNKMHFFDSNIIFDIWTDPSGHYILRFQRINSKSNLSVVLKSKGVNDFYVYKLIRNNDIVYDFNINGTPPFSISEIVSIFKINSIIHFLEIESTKKIIIQNNISKISLLKLRNSFY